MTLFVRSRLVFFFIFICAATAALDASAKTNDFSSVQVGSLKIKYKDGEFNPESPDKISYPGLFGSMHYLMVGRRNVGFGGSAGDLELRIPRTTPGFDSLFSKMNGGLQIANHLYTKDKPPVGFPNLGAFLEIDYQKSRPDGSLTTATLLRKPEYNERSWAKGSVKFKRISRKVKKFTDSFNNKKQTITVQLLFTIDATVKELAVTTTPPKGSSSTKIMKQAPVYGQFLITLHKTITIVG